MYPYTVPDEIVFFIENQFNRFGVGLLSPKIVNEISEFIIEYVVKNNYYPQIDGEAERRYAVPGLTEPEKYQLIGPLEYHLKAQLRETCSMDEIHLAAWASLLWCWSEEGIKYVSWFKHTQDIAEILRARSSLQAG